MSCFYGIRKAHLNDIVFITLLEKSDHATYVHAEPENTHISQFSDDRFIYIIAENGEGMPIGYSLLVRENETRIEWRRIIMQTPGQGSGFAFMTAILKELSEKGVKTIWLDVYAENTRARSLYDKLGFQETGTQLSANKQTLTVMQYDF